MKKLIALFLLLAGSLSSLNAMEAREPDPSSPTLKIVIRLGGLSIPIDQTTTVDDLKQKIQKITRIFSTTQRIILFAGRSGSKEELPTSSPVSEGPTSILTKIYTIDQIPSDKQRLAVMGEELGPDVLLKKEIESKGYTSLIFVVQEPITRSPVPVKLKEIESKGYTSLVFVVQEPTTSSPVTEGPTATITSTALDPSPLLAPLGRRDTTRFARAQKTAAVLTTAVLIAAVAGVMKIRSYRNTKKRLIKKYNLGTLTLVQNKVWLATVLASYRMPWYLHRIIRQHEGTLADLVGDDPRAVAELYYGHAPTRNELNKFLSKFFSGTE